MATDAGIKMMPSRLFTVSGTNHFLTQRFDRLPGGKKLFTQSLRALSPSANDYMNIFWLCDKLVRKDGRTSFMGGVEESTMTDVFHRYAAQKSAGQGGR